MSVVTHVVVGIAAGVIIAAFVQWLRWNEGEGCDSHHYDEAWTVGFRIKRYGPMTLGSGWTPQAKKKEWCQHSGCAATRGVWEDVATYRATKEDAVTSLYQYVHDKEPDDADHDGEEPTGDPYQNVHSEEDADE